MNKNWPSEIDPDDSDNNIYEIDPATFQSLGGLWLCNSILQHFGLAILIEHQLVRGKNKTVLIAVRTKYKGFNHATTERSVKRVRNFIRQTSLGLETSKQLHFVQALRRLNQKYKGVI